MQSEEISELAGALLKAQSEFKPILRGKTAKIKSERAEYSYNYADLSDIRETVLQTLTENGLVVTQSPSIFEGQPALTTTLLHISGQWISDQMLLLIASAGAQGQGSAITYARRYSFTAILGLVTESDDDGAAGSHGGSESNSGGQSSQRRQSGDFAYTYQSGNDDFDTILEAAELASENEFIQSLAGQIRDRGSLSDKQIESGVRTALKIISGG